MLASFEKTTDHLFEAAVHSRTDAVRSPRPPEQSLSP